MWLDDKSVERIAKREQGLRFMIDEWESVIDLWLDSDEFGAHRKELIVIDIWAKCFGNDISKFTKADQMRVAQALTRLGWQRATKWRNKKMTKIWRKAEIKEDQTT